MSTRASTVQNEFPSIKFTKLSVTDSDDNNGEIIAPSAQQTEARSSRNILKRTLLFGITTFCIIAILINNSSLFSTKMPHVSFLRAHETQESRVEMQKSLLTGNSSINYFDQWHNITTDDYDLETVKYQISPQILTIKDQVIPTAKLTLRVSSNRVPCDKDSGALCMYRMYLDGPSLHGTYFYQKNFEYDANITLYEAGIYKAIVILETPRNASTHIGRYEDEYILSPFDKRGYQLFERISVTEIIVDFPRNDNDLVILTPDTYVSILPPCQYKIKDMETNVFDWVKTPVLKSRGFSPSETLLIPPEMLDTTADEVHFLSQMKIKADWEDTVANKAADVHPEWIQPYQSYVLHGRTCKQPLVTAPIFKSNFGNEEINLVFLGTSRLRQIYGMLRSLLEPTHSVRRMNFKMLEIKSVRPKEVVTHLQDHFQLHSICNAEFLNETTVFIISQGIWEAKTHRRSDGLYTEHDFGIHAMLDYIQTTCDGFKYKVILATNPGAQPLDMQVDPLKERRKFFGLHFSLTGPRQEFAKWEYARLAEKFDYYIVDLFKISLARRDAVIDNLHYMLFNRKDKSRLPFNIGNDATFGFSQLVLAATMQALDDAFKGV